MDIKIEHTDGQIIATVNDRGVEAIYREDLGIAIAYNGDILEAVVFAANLALHNAVQAVKDNQKGWEAPELCIKAGLPEGIAGNTITPDFGR